MNKIWLFWCLTLNLLLSDLANALEPINYRSHAEEQRFQALTAELRCVMCQNQSIADSNAPIAHDLRMEVLQLMREGKTNAQIKQYLVERYTEFVLYEPPLKKTTWLLWTGPFLILLVGAGVIAVVIRKKNNALVNSTNDNDEAW
jgi:cytochrome c-type biogenesis protein CcmH